MRYLAGSMEAIDIAFMRYLVGGLIVLPLAFINRCRWPGWNIVIHIALLGLVFFAIFPWLVAIAFNYTTAARGALVLSTMPLWSMLLGYYLKHEHLTARRSLGVFLAVAGVAVTLVDKIVMPADATSGFIGESIMLLAALLGAVYSVSSKKPLHSVSAYCFTPAAMLLGCLFLMPVSVSGGLSHNLGTIPLMPLLVLLYLGIFGGGLAFLLFNWVLDKTTPTIITLFVTLNPLTAIFLAWWLLGESLTRFFFAGAVMVLAGLMLALIPGKVVVNELT